MAVAVGCGNKPVSERLDRPERDEAGAVPPSDAGANGVIDAAPLVLEPQPLGLADISNYRWRKRAGHPAFRLAVKAEHRDDWPAVIAACRQALAADPGHLEAAWLLAAGLAKLGKLDEVLAPLRVAVSGDFGKWGQPSLDLPAMQAFLATPVGAAWRQRVAEDRVRYAAVLARAVIVTADGDLFAVVPAGATGESARWYRLTRTYGLVRGALIVPAAQPGQPAQKFGYVAWTGPAGKRVVGVGVVDLMGGLQSKPVAAGPAPMAIALAYSAVAPVGFWVGAGGSRVSGWRQLDDDFHFHPLPPHTARPVGPWLEVTAKGSARLHAMPANLVADWDEQSLASAIRIGSSNRVVSLASPGLIDGNTAAWSPDRSHLAFVAQLDDHCAAGAVNTAAFVADASTGGTRELERAAGGIALTWLGERTLAIAGDHGVTIRSLDDNAAPIAITGATGLAIPRERPRCAPSEPGEPSSDDAEPAEPSDPTEPGE